MARPAPASCAAALLVLLAGCTTANVAELNRPGTAAPPSQDLRLAAYNVAFGAAVGGLGALVNGRDAPPLRRLARGAGRGALGGAVVHAGKWTAGQVSARQSLGWAWPALLLHGAGTSVVENAAHDRPPLDRLALDVAFVRLDVRPGTGAVRARLLPVSALAFALMVEKHDLDVGRSLAYGVPLFTGDGRGKSPVDFGGASTGFAFLNTVYVSRDDDEFYDTAAHELVHVMQYREFARTASLYAPLDGQLRRSGAYRAVARWVYLDNPVMNAAAYFGVEGGSIERPCKYDNWLEREAEAFGSRRAVGVCP